MYRIGNYLGASGEWDGGGFTFKSIHIFRGNISLSSFSESNPQWLQQCPESKHNHHHYHHCSALVFYDFSLVKSVLVADKISDPIKSFSIFPTNSLRVGRTCVCFLN